MNIANSNLSSLCVFLLFSSLLLAHSSFSDVIPVTVSSFRSVQQRSVRAVSGASSCNLDSECSNGKLCCSSVLGKVAGVCYDPIAFRCCARDGNVVPYSQNLTGECCTYDDNEGSFTTCPQETPKCSATNSGPSCTETCVSESCTNGFCCHAPASTSPYDGRCYYAGQTCCFDGRICPNGDCDIPSNGQCCGVNLQKNEYSFCPSGYFCNVVGSALSCTTYAYGSNSSSSGSSQPLSLGTASYSQGDSGSSSHTGLIIAIVVPVAVVLLVVVLIVIFLVRRRSQSRKSDKIVQPTVPPVYQPNYMSSQKLQPGFVTEHPPAYDDQALASYQPMTDIKQPSESQYEKIAA